MQLAIFQELIRYISMRSNKRDVPIGAFITRKGQIISKAVNQVEKNQSAIMHAEIIAILKASKILKNKFLHECQMYVSLEPCAMCIEAIKLARIQYVYFGTYSNQINTITKTKIYGGFSEKDCSALINDFFLELRK